MSDATRELVPPGVDTDMSTVPVPAGETAVRLVEETYCTDVAATVPNITDDPATKPVPVITVDVPPMRGPAEGVTAKTVGTGSYVNWFALLIWLVPPGVVTVTLTVPDPAGDTLVIVVLLTTTTLAAA